MGLDADVYPVALDVAHMNSDRAVAEELADRRRRIERGIRRESRIDCPGRRVSISMVTVPCV